MNIEAFRSFVATVPWQFAKTMPENPHWYTLRKHCNEVSFINAVEFIRAQGQVRMFKSRPYTEYDCDGWTYWTMGSPIDQTILINRARQC